MHSQGDSAGEERRSEGEGGGKKRERERGEEVEESTGIDSLSLSLFPPSPLSLSSLFFLAAVVAQVRRTSCVLMDLALLSCCGDRGGERAWVSDVPGREPPLASLARLPSQQQHCTHKRRLFFVHRDGVRLAGSSGRCGEDEAGPGEETK